MSKMTLKVENDNLDSRHSFFLIIQNIIENLQDLAFHSPFIYSMIKFGTISTNKVNFFSDIDLVFLIDSSNKQQVKNLVIDFYSEILIETIDYDDKLILFIKNRLINFSKPIKVEIFIVNSITKVIKYIINNKANKKEVIDSIVFDKYNQLVDYFNEVQFENLKKEISLEDDPVYHINRFLEAFENATTAMTKGDNYNFYFQMNICFHHLISLECITMDKTDYLYLPRFFLNKLESDKKDFYRTNHPNLNMYKANNLRIAYLNKFQEITNNKELAVKISFQLNSKIKFLQNLIDRTYFWNFRDISYIHPNKIKPNMIFRSSNLSKYPFEQVKKLRTGYGINSIIDLRKNSEIEKCSYSEEIKNSFYYINIPIGEKKNELVFNLTYTELDNQNAFYEILPRYFGNEIKRILIEISKIKPAIVIHCHAGKDRTGMIIALLLLICNISEELIIEDYMYSGSNVDKSNIELFLKFIRGFGNVFTYLNYIGIEKITIEKIQKRILV